MIHLAELCFIVFACRKFWKQRGMRAVERAPAAPPPPPAPPGPPPSMFDPVVVVDALDAAGLSEYVEAISEAICEKPAVSLEEVTTLLRMAKVSGSRVIELQRCLKSSSSQRLTAIPQLPPAIIVRIVCDSIHWW